MDRPRPTRHIAAAQSQVCLQTGLVEAQNEWLEKYLPPKFEGGTPFTIKNIEISHNHVDQEIVRAEYERTPQVIRSLAKEIKLVILPTAPSAFQTG